MYAEAKVLVDDFEKEFFTTAEKHEKGLVKGLQKLLKNKPE